jgi:hypothetical protein
MVMVRTGWADRMGRWRKVKISARTPAFRLTGFKNNMQKPNYQFEKRRKEMEKKAKKEEKRRNKLAAERSADSGNASEPAVPIEPA